MPARRSASGRPSRMNCDNDSAAHNVLSLCCHCRKIHPAFFQPMSDAHSGLLGRRNHNQLTGTKRGTDELAHFIQEEAIVGMELSHVAGSRDCRERSQRRCEESSGKRVVYGACQIQGHPRFQDVSLRAGSNRMSNKFVVLMKSQKHNFGTRADATKFSECLKAVKFRHRDVQDNDMGIETQR
jgi:hypothetical protein